VDLIDRFRFGIAKLLIRRAATNELIPFRKIVVWDPWVGCSPISEACESCYYRYNPSTTLTKTKDFELKAFPDGKNIITGFMSDWFHPAADMWRKQMWSVIKANPNSSFLLLTKRIDRFFVSLPEDWGQTGYSNVILGVTVENQKQADLRLPLLLDIPVSGKFISCSPLLESINIESHLDGIKYVSVAGEVAKNGRMLDLNWVIDVKKQCERTGATMFFKDTGSKIKYDGEIKKVHPLFQRMKAKTFSRLLLQKK
jgi:protein gp37